MLTDQSNYACTDEALGRVVYRRGRDLPKTKGIPSASICRAVVPKVPTPEVKTMRPGDMKAGLRMEFPQAGRFHDYINSYFTNIEQTISRIP